MMNTIRISIFKDINKWLRNKLSGVIFWFGTWCYFNCLKESINDKKNGLRIDITDADYFPFILAWFDDRLINLAFGKQLLTEIVTFIDYKEDDSKNQSSENKEKNISCCYLRQLNSSKMFYTTVYFCLEDLPHFQRDKVLKKISINNKTNKNSITSQMEHKGVKSQKLKLQKGKF